MNSGVSPELSVILAVPVFNFLGRARNSDICQESGMTKRKTEKPGEKPGRRKTGTAYRRRTGTAYNFPRVHRGTRPYAAGGAGRAEPGVGYAVL